MKFEMKLKMRLVFTCLVAGMCLGHSSVFAKNQPANPKLQSCINGLDSNGMDPSNPSKYSSPDPARFENGTNDLKDCTSGVSADLKLFQGSSEFTGCYDDGGKRVANSNPPCNTDSVCSGLANCVFEISATVTPTCRKDSDGITPLAKCGKAESFQIDYKVSQVKALPGMGTFATVQTAVGTDKPPTIIPYSAIRAASYTKVDCKELYPNNIKMQYQSGVDSLGQPICGTDPNQQKIDDLQSEVCRSQILAAWNNGGASSGSTSSGNTASNLCEKIYVEKVFTLQGGSHTTAECTSAGGTIKLLSGADAGNLSTYPGGRVHQTDLQGALLDDATLIAKYGLPASWNGAFYCYKTVTTSKSLSFSSSGVSKGWEDTSAVTTSGVWSYTFSSECVPQSGQTFVKGIFGSSSASVSGSWDKIRCRRENSCTSGGVDGGACDEGDHESNGSISSSVAVSASPTSTGVTLSASYSLSSYDTGRADKCKGHDNDFSGHDWCCTWIGSLSISGSATIECQFKVNQPL